MKSPGSYLFIAPLTSRSTSLAQIIETTLSAFDLKPLEHFGNYMVTEDDLREDTIFDSIHRFIEQADFIIADISGANPNVMHGIGLAQGMRKTVLPIVRRDEKIIPASLGRINYLVYDPDETESLSRYLENWAAHYLPVKA